MSRRYATQMLNLVSLSWCLSCQVLYAPVLSYAIVYTTIPNHPGDVPEGTLRAILKQAGVTPEEFLGT